MGVGVKGELKAARARMQAGDPAEALSIIQAILDGSSPDLKEKQTLYAVLVMQGMAGLAVDDLTVAESSFRRATETMPDAPQVNFLWVVSASPLRVACLGWTPVWYAERYCAKLV